MALDTLTHPRLIICEGASDEAFFRKLIKNRGLPPFCVRHTGAFDRANKGGKSKYGTFLQGLPTWRGFYSLQSIIVVGDNDTVPADDFQAIQHQIANAAPNAIPAVKYGVPKKPMQFEPGTPARLAIMMLPNSSTTGDLETLCFQAAQSVGGPINACVSSFVSCVGATGWPPSKLSKLELRVHMAARHQKNPALALQHAWTDAVTKQLIPLSDVCFDPIVTFLKTA